MIDHSENFVKDIEVEPGLRHNKPRPIILKNDRIWIGGWKNGPETHTGDNDPSLVFC